jgi:hypothetical protein
MLSGALFIIAIYDESKTNYLFITLFEEIVL